MPCRICSLLRNRSAKIHSGLLLTPAGTSVPQKMAAGKSVGYKKWATKFNLKEMSKTLLFLQEQKISSADELQDRAAAATERYHAMGDSIKAAETRLAEIAVPRFASWYPPSIWKAI